MSFGDDTTAEICEEPDQWVDVAAKNGLSENAVKQLKIAIEEHIEIFKLRFGSGSPANFPSMKIALDPTKKAVKVKSRRYPVYQQIFLDEHITQLSKMRFIKPFPQALWQAAPHLVPKDSKFGPRKTIELRSVTPPRKQSSCLSL